MSNIKVLIIEDEVLIAEHLKNYMVGFGFSKVFLAHTKNMAIQLIDHLNPDLVLLDLHLQQPRDGLDIARIIDEKGETPYIFITANADMLIIQEATYTKATSYITKPIKKADLFAAVQIALKPAKSEELKCLQVKDSGSTLSILHRDILYIESSGNYIIIYTNAKKTIVRLSLEWAELELPGNQFMRIHRSYIVNLREVQL
jgi:DNA-binding LytR/AlgR family response regulator